MMLRNDKLNLKTFVSKNADESEGYEKALFNHELYKIYEGITIASAINGKELYNEWKDYKTMKFTFANEQDIMPFKAFSMSSSGGFSSLYYMSPLDSDCGDIVIDCGFSKLFFELTEDGIDRYVKNIAIWMLQLEKKDIKYGSTIDARLAVPPKFYFKINYNPTGIVFHKFDIMKDVDLVFLVDGTGSMRFFIKAVRNCCKDIATQCHNNFPGREFRFGAVVYRDTIVTEKNPCKKKDAVDFHQLTNDISIIKRFFKKIKAKGGGDDGPEDWVSGYEYLLHKIDWKNDSIKIVIHICDAEGHGTSFTCNPLYTKYFYKIPKFSDKHNILEDEEVYNQIQINQDMKFRVLVDEAAKKELNFYCLNNHEKSNYCFYQTKKLFKECGGKKFIIKNQYKSIDYSKTPKFYKEKADSSDSDDDFDDNNSDSDDTLEEEEDNEIKQFISQLTDQVKIVLKKAVDSSVAVSHSQGETKYEVDCNREFEEDFYNTEAKYQKKYEKWPNNENHQRRLKKPYFKKKYRCLK